MSTITAPPPLDVAKVRADFPILDRLVNGHPLVYLDSGATSQKPQVVLDAMSEHLARHNGNVSRSVHTVGTEATEAYEGARAKVAAFIGAASPDEVVFTKNVTEAVNLVAYAFLAATVGGGESRFRLGPGDRIVVSELEHHSNLVPWQLLAQEKDADLEFVPFDAQGRLIAESYEVLLRTRPRLVAFTHKSNGLGTLNPVAEMAAQAHEAGALVLVDGAQAVPHLPVDVQATGADFYVFSGHKVLGPTGSGALWARRELLEAMPPFMSGGEMISSVHLRHATFNEVPHKFEAGTPDIAAAIGLGAAVDYLEEIGMARVRAHEEALTAYALEVLTREVPPIRIHGPRSAAERAGIVTFTLPDVHAHDVATLLDRHAVAIRAGHHCTQPLHERLGESATARASFSVYSGRDDIDRLAAGLRDVLRVFGLAPAPVAVAPGTPAAGSLAAGGRA